VTLQEVIHHGLTPQLATGIIRDNNLSTMGSNGHHLSAMASPAPYDDIDIDWVEQRLKDRAISRRSRLSAYFDGVMEFAERPPSLSRSPSVEVPDSMNWQAGGQRSAGHPTQSANRRMGVRGNDRRPPRFPSRRSTTESDSDLDHLLLHLTRSKSTSVSIPILVPDLLQGHLTPVQGQKRGYQRTSHSRKPNQRPKKLSSKVFKLSNAHSMETRSKSREMRRAWHVGNLKYQSERRKVT
jgi:hypothetical protein